MDQFENRFRGGAFICRDCGIAAADDAEGIFGHAVSGESDRDPVRRGNAGRRPFTALLQKRIEASVMGRVFLLFDSISLLPSVFGLLAAGFLADQVGIAAIFALGGLATALTAVVAFLILSVRNLENGSRA